MESKLATKTQGRAAKVITLSEMHGVNVSTCVRVWESIGKPAMEYAAEVWGTKHLKGWRK